ncbi:MAG: 5-oxoprolinase subunit PxpB [Fusobacteriaceae bacterium]|jgi:KipI family sensor histidine kinase inhibitor|nr:5-oxoprolinase subunit PxpB [Fusobacteriaceae bacterium]
MRFLHAGDSALIVELGNEISPLINSKVRKITEYLDSLKNDFILDLLPTYRSVIIYYDPRKISYEEMVELVSDNCDTSYQSMENVPKQVVEIPVLYGGEYGPDIETIAKHNKLTTDEVVQIHASRDYLVYMLGFTPGFPYLGGMSKKIATPRLKEPRKRIPAGSVGIAGEQTGIYPLSSPGGWQLLGRTPLKIFNLQSDPHFLLEAGDTIRFVPIAKGEYERIAQLVDTGKYKETRYRA